MLLEFDEVTSLTEQLRILCTMSGVPWSTGLYHDGKRVASDKITTIGVGGQSLTFEESDGAFDCIDGMSVHEAFAAGVCAWSELGVADSNQREQAKK